nr:classical arabinogalactan protein 9-like [Aegilops tauschii subsp. strangulata]
MALPPTPTAGALQPPPSCSRAAPHLPMAAAPRLGLACPRRLAPDPHLPPRASIRPPPCSHGVATHTHRRRPAAAAVLQPCCAPPPWPPHPASASPVPAVLLHRDASPSPAPTPT